MLAKDLFLLLIKFLKKMIEKQTFQNYAIKQQTNLGNVLREYLQHLFLTYFYQKEISQNFLFKGGTALKLVFGSPRFSEDLDFSGLKNSGNYEKILEEVLLNFSFENIEVDLIESKPTSGGHLAILEFNLLGEKLELRNEISFRPQRFLARETTIIASEITPAYKIFLLDRRMMVKEKIEALLTRQKPRDFFDLYFILRKEELRQVLELEAEQRKKIISYLKEQDKKIISNELKRLLPKSFWSVIKDLPQALKREIELSNPKG